MEAARRRLPKLAPTGRAGVRALKGPIRRSRRREAPIRCGFARTYEAGSRGSQAKTARSPLRQRTHCPLADYRGAIIHTSSSEPRTGDVYTRVELAFELACQAVRRRIRAPRRPVSQALKRL